MLGNSELQKHAAAFVLLTSMQHLNMLTKSACKLAASAWTSGSKEEKAHSMRLWEHRQVLQQPLLL